MLPEFCTDKLSKLLIIWGNCLCAFPRKLLTERDWDDAFHWPIPVNWEIKFV